MANIEALSHLEKFLEQHFNNSGSGSSGGSTPTASPLVYKMETLSSSIISNNASYPQWVLTGTTTIDEINYNIYNYNLGGKSVKDINLVKYSFSSGNIFMVLTNSDGSETKLPKGSAVTYPVSLSNVNVTKITLYVNENTSPSGTFLFGLGE